MFSLTPEDLSGNIIDCAGGPASFNAEVATNAGGVVSCDPLYQFSAEEIRTRVAATRETLVANAEATRNEFVWDEFESPQHLGEMRMAIMRRFFEDFPTGLKERRYRACGLPSLPFEDGEFDLALCSHLLFTYSDRLSVDFHVSAIEEMCRVAGEARIFPLLKAYGGSSPHLTPVTTVLRNNGYRTGNVKVPYEFQRGGDEMLVVKK